MTFAAGETSKTITVHANGDRIGEANETFSVNIGLSGGNAVVGDAQGVVTIVDDEPRITIASVSKSEGNSSVTKFVFAVSLSAASSAAVTVNFATADGSARAPGDYAAQSGLLTFNAGETSKTVTVNVNGDRSSRIRGSVLREPVGRVWRVRDRAARAPAWFATTTGSPRL